MAFAGGYQPQGGKEAGYSIFDAQKDKREEEVATILRQMNELSLKNDRDEATNKYRLIGADRAQDNLLASGRENRKMHNMLEYLSEGNSMDKDIGRNFDPDKYKLGLEDYIERNPMGSATSFANLWEERQAKEASEILLNLQDEKEMKRISDKDFNLGLRDNAEFRRWFQDLSGGGIEDLKSTFMTNTTYDPYYRTGTEAATDFVKDHPFMTVAGVGGAAGVGTKMRSVMAQAKVLEGGVSTAQVAYDKLINRPINEGTGKPFTKTSDAYKKWMESRGQNPLTGDPKYNSKVVQKAKAALENAKKVSKPYGSWTTKVTKALPGLLPYLAPDVGGRLGGLVAGDEGEVIGRTLGAGYMGAKILPSALKKTKTGFLKYLMKKGPGILSKAAAKGMSVAMLDSPLLGPGDIAGVALAIGISGVELVGLYKAWKKLNK